MKKNKGFTLVELVVAISIMTIIIVLAIPSIRVLQTRNANRRYENYSKTLQSGAKLYTDSNSIDMFGYEGSGCYDVTFNQLLDKKLVKDIDYKDVTCADPSQKRTFVRVKKYGEDFEYQVSIYCNDSKNVKVYENLIKSSTAICTEESSHTPPEITIKPPKTDGYVRNDAFKVTITLYDQDGLLENNEVSYGWCKTNDCSDATSFKKVEFKNKRNDKKVSIKVDAPEGEGVYYLKIVPDRVVDVFNNKVENPQIAGPYMFDNTPPTVTVRAYKRSATGGKEGSVLSEVTVDKDHRTGKINSYTNTVNDWLNKENYPNGVYYEVEYKDNIKAKNLTWFYNESGLKKNSSKIDDLQEGEAVTFNNKEGTTYKTLSADGYRKGKMVIQDESGNKVTVNIEAPIDKTPPKTPTIKNPYENKWTNKPYKLTLTSSDSLSGLSYFQYKYDSSASWVTYENSNESPFDTTDFEKDRNENVSIRAVDVAGNVSAESKTPIKIDKTKPTLKVTAYKRTASGGATGSAVGTLTITSDGTLDSYSNMVSKWLNMASYPYGIYYDVQITDNLSLASGKWTYNNKNIKPGASGATTLGNQESYTLNGTSQNIALAFKDDGYRKGKLEVKDSAGNTINLNLIAQLDRVAPEKPGISNPYENKWTNQKYKLTLTSSDAMSGLARYEYRYANTDWKKYDDSAKTRFLTTDFSQERNENVYIRAVDVAGNYSSENQSPIKIDKTAPKITVTAYQRSSSGGSTGGSVGSLTVTSSGTLDSYSNSVSEWLNKNNYPYGIYYNLQITDNLSLASGKWSYNNTNIKPGASGATTLGNQENYTLNGTSQNIALSFQDDGYRKGKLEVKDSAGNTINLNLIAQLDRVAPEKPGISNPYENKWTNQDYKLTLTSSDAMSGLARYEYKYANTDWKKYDDSAKTRFLTTDFSKERNENVYIRAMDVAGNYSSENQSPIKIDKTPPIVTITAYKRNYNGSNSQSVGSAVSNKNNNVVLQSYSNTVNSWLNGINYPYGINYYISVEDNFSLSQQKWSYNAKDLAASSSNVSRLSSTIVENIEGQGTKISKSVSFDEEGYRKGEYEVKDSAGNTSVIKIIAPIDLTKPSVSAIAYNKSNNKPISNTAVANNTTSIAKIDSYSIGVNGWLNNSQCPNGVKYSFSLSDKYGLNYALWSYNYPNNKDSNSTKGTNTTNFSSNTSATDTHSLEEEGYRTGKYVAYDMAGNYVEIDVKALMDRTGPTKPIISNDSSGKWTNQNITVSFSSGDALSGLSGYQCEYKKDSWQSCASSLSYDSEMNKTLFVMAKDNAGNLSDDYSYTSLKIDKTPPTIVVKAYKRNSSGKKADSRVLASATNDGYNTISKWCNAKDYPYGIYYEMQSKDNYGLDEGIWSWNEDGLKSSASNRLVLVKSITDNFHESTNSTQDHSFSSDGYRYGKYQVTDLAGNLSKVFVVVPIDKVGPTITVSKSNTNSTSGVTANITCSDSLVSVTKCNNKTTSDTINGLKADRTISATDAVGNTSSKEVKINQKIQKSSCTSCKSCVGAGCASSECTNYSCSSGNYHSDGRCYMEFKGVTADEKCRTASSSYGVNCLCHDTDANQYCEFPVGYAYCSKSTCTSYNSSCSSCGCNSWSGWVTVDSCQASSSINCQTLYY